MTLQQDRPSERPPERPLDGVGWRLLRLLQENARLPLRQIGEMIGLTAPAVTERVRRLEDAGLVTGYHAEIDTFKLGLPIMAFIHITSSYPTSDRFAEFVQTVPEVLECHCVTGVESYILKIAVTSVPHLNSLIHRLKPYGDLRTSVVLSTQIKRRIIDMQIMQGER